MHAAALASAATPGVARRPAPRPPRGASCRRSSTASRRPARFFGALNASAPSAPADDAPVPTSPITVTVFSTRKYMLATQIPTLERAFPGRVRCVEAPLNAQTAQLAAGSDAVCLFVNDVADADAVDALADAGVRFIAMRCAGYDRVDVARCEARGVLVARVPAYSPHAIAEHAIALMLCLNRQLVKADARVRHGNYSLSGLVGFDMHGKTVGIVGTGKIGRCVGRVLLAMGCEVLAHDVHRSEEAEAMGMRYVDALSELLERSDVVTLHCPLLPSTKHIINAETLAMMKPGAMLINTSRGGLIDADALCDALDDRRVACAGLDVYEGEAGVFFEDKSQETDTVPGSSVGHDWDFALSNLANRPNVLVTPHQAFLTAEALGNIAQTTADNLGWFEHTRGERRGREGGEGGGGWDGAVDEAMFNGAANNIVEG